LKNLSGDSTTSTHGDTVGIGKPELQVRKACTVAASNNKDHAPRSL